MRIAHGHFDISMPEDSLQRQDVPTLHHVVAGERVPEDVSHLAWGVETGTLIGFTERRSAGAEQLAIPWITPLEYQPLQIRRNRH